MRPILGIVAASSTALLGCSSCNAHHDNPQSDATLPPSTSATTSDRVQPLIDGRAEPHAIREDGISYIPLVFSFDVATVDVWIEDAKMSTAFEEILNRQQATLVINGGFFDPEERPLGLAVSHGRLLSAFSRTMSGGVLSIGKSQADLIATEAYEPTDGALDGFAVQCRPRLVVDGKVNIKRDDGKRSARTALCIKDHGAKVVVVLVRDASDPSYGPSLFALGAHLAAEGCESALNLDGGPSTGVAFRDEHGVHSRPPIAGVRHAVVWKTR